MIKLVALKQLKATEEINIIIQFCILIIRNYTCVKNHPFLKAAIIRKLNSIFIAFHEDKVNYKSKRNCRISLKCHFQKL